MSAELVSYEASNILIPTDWQRAGFAYCIPGSTGITYEGPMAVVLTPAALCLCGPDGIIHAIHLSAIYSVRDREFRGILLERETSVGPILTAPRNTAGIEVLYETATGMEGRLNILVFFMNSALQWSGEIASAAYRYQIQEQGHAIIRSHS